MDWLKNLLDSYPGLALVVPLATGALALIRWAVSRHDFHSSKRKEFLLHWKDPTKLDDVSVEVLVRQLTGTYLPAVAVRRVCSRENLETVQTLHRLADIWTLVTWDAQKAEASWKRGAANPTARTLWGVAAWAAFSLAFMVGATAVVYVAIEKPSGNVGLVTATWGVALVVGGIGALTRTDAWGTASKWGNDLLRAVNNCGPLPAEGASDQESSR